jgi:hypothetical protein
MKKKLVPKHAHMRIPTNNEAARKTQTQAQILRIKKEIKFLYNKKKQLNIQLHHTRIYNANTWQQM